MHDILLRVCVLALGLLMSNHPGVEEWDDITTVGMQKHEERLQSGGQKLDHEMAPVSEEMTHADNRGPPEDRRNIQSHHRVSEKDEVLEDVTVAGHKSLEGDPSWSQNSKSEPETALNTSQIENKANLQLDMESKGDPSRPQGQQDNPEEQLSSEEQESPSHLHTVISENETSEKANADWEGDYLWYLWNILSVISMIRLFRKYTGKNSQMKQGETRTCTSADVPLPDSNTLQLFHSKCVQVSSDKKWKQFLEGFTNDLLEAMRGVCDRNGGMVFDDFQVVDVCNIIVPFTPPDPYSFQCLLWNNPASDLQECGQIKLVENQKIQNGCPCQSPNSDDMVCLLHCESEKVNTKATDVRDVLLCTKNSPFLSKSQVTRWFQSTVKQAWEQISHKYEFELNIRYIGAPGALVVRFRSGKKISFSMNPVVKVNTDAHFFITPRSPNTSDTFWTLSLTNYEDRFLQHISKRLPVNSCHSQTLEIANFLHKRQTALSGSCALKDFHFKTALMHLLLTKEPSQWKPRYMACRLRDLLAFMERSLEKRQLHHVLIGNPLTQRVIKLPAEFTQSKTVNLFHPLVVQDCIYRNAVMHFQEMLRNAHMLINDYVEVY